ncbi:MAG: hypothetical protein ACP5Q5_11095 [Brevinematia bacterium]
MKVSSYNPLAKFLKIKRMLLEEAINTGEINKKDIYKFKNDGTKIIHWPKKEAYEELVRKRLREKF